VGEASVFYLFSSVGIPLIHDFELLSIVPSGQVKLILLDDFATAPQRVYAEVLRFLGLPHDGRSEFPRLNEGKAARIEWL
jgi:hypothetical protein